MSLQVYSELKTRYNDLDSAIINPAELIKGKGVATLQPVVAVVLNFTRHKMANERKKIEDWLKVRLQQ